jgi:hypothetical protein
MSEELIKKISGEIGKSGHPVSIKISNILQKRGWFVRNSVRYPLEKNGFETGEIDVIATIESNLIKNTYDNLIIECKKQTDPWVFFNQNWYNADVFTLNHNRANDDHGSIYSWLDDSGIFKKHYYYNKKLATYYFVAFKKPDEGPAKTIDKALTQVLRSTIFYWGKYLKTEVDHIFYPIIVFDGELFEVNYQNDDPIVEPTNHICLHYEFDVDNIDKIHSYNSNTIYRWVSSKPFVIDVVRLDYFENFLNNFKV